jgi:peptide/nickel transport system substrate-binding protein
MTHDKTDEVTTPNAQSALIDAFAAGKLSRRQFVQRASVLGMSAAAVGALLAACGGEETTETTDGGGGEPTTTLGDGQTDTTAPQGTYKQGGTLRVGNQRPGSPLDPVAMDNVGTYTLCATTFEYLCGPGEGAGLAPMLAESWEPNADGSVWTFKIRQGVKWHSGGDLTAADVVATLERLVPGNQASYLSPGAAKAIDDYTVEVTLNAPDGQYPYQMSIYNPQSLITPVDYEVGTTLDARPDGTGPFKLASYDIATKAVFERNDAWWGGVPFLDAVEIYFTDDLATNINGLLAGELDALVGFSVIGGEAIFADSSLTIESIPGAAHRQIWMNCREGNFADKRVRQAVAKGIDRQALIDTLLQGRGVMGNDHPVAPVYPYHDASLPQRERDVEGAKALLEEAGKAGLTVTMHAPTLLEIPQLAELVQSQLAEIGMNITLNVESTDTFYDRWCKVYDSTNEPTGCDGGEEFGIVDYGNRGTPDVYLVKAYATGEWNSSHYISEEFRAAVKEYQAALDDEGRAAAIVKVQAIAHEDVPYVIPYFYDYLQCYRNTFAGVRGTGLGHFYLGTAGFLA